jgi:4-hydroxy-2-oxoheptanedioate aldolase
LAQVRGSHPSGSRKGRLAPGFDREELEMISALHDIVAACEANSICAALHCGTPEYAARAIEWGFNKDFRHD